MNFINFIGNEKVKEQLSYMMESGRLPQAIIIEGACGCGKRTLALDIATALVCKSSSGKACGQCAACRKAMAGGHPDISLYSADNRGTSLSVNTVREIKKDAYVIPNEADYKIYILGNAGSMNANAQNALLKIIEEPPANVLFILTTESKTSFLETVLSRCVVLTLDTAGAQAAAEYVMEKFPDADAGKVRQAACACDGNIGSVIDSIQDSTLSKYVEMAAAVCGGIVSNSEYELVQAVSCFEKDNEAAANVCALLRTIFRDALILSSSGTNFISSERAAAEKLAATLSKEKLLRLMDAVGEIQEMVKRNANNNLLVTKLCFSLREAVGR